MDKHLLKYMVSYWVKHLNENTKNNTQDVIIVDEMNLLSATTLQQIHKVCICLLQN